MCFWFLLGLKRIRCWLDDYCCSPYFEYFRYSSRWKTLFQVGVWLWPYGSGAYTLQQHVKNSSESWSFVFCPADVWDCLEEERFFQRGLAEGKFVCVPVGAGLLKYGFNGDYHTYVWYEHTKHWPSTFGAQSTHHYSPPSPDAHPSRWVNPTIGATTWLPPD